LTSFKRLCALLVVTALAGVGCGSSSGGSAKAGSDSSSTDGTSSSSSSSSSSDGRTAKELAADKKQAQDSLLVLSDLPPGWTSKPASSTSSDSPEQKAATKKFADCIGADASLLDDADSKDEAKAKSDKFSESKDELSFDMRASVGESSDKQQIVLDTFQKPEVTSCFGDFFTEAITFALEHPDNGQSLPAGVKIGTVKVEKVDLALDTDAVTYRSTIPVTVQNTTIEVVSDFMLALVDRTGLTLTFESNGKAFPQDLELEIANKAIAKAKAA
jgi:hypothetical protein